MSKLKRAVITGRVYDVTNVIILVLAAPNRAHRIARDDVIGWVLDLQQSYPSKVADQNKVRITGFGRMLYTGHADSVHPAIEHWFSAISDI